MTSHICGSNEAFNSHMSSELPQNEGGKSTGEEFVFAMTAAETQTGS